LILGWVPFLWWVPIGLGPFDRVGALLAVTTGVLVAWIAVAENYNSRARLLLPKLVGADVAILVAAAAATWATWPLLSSSSPQHTLTIMLNGWDHVAHFGMVHVIDKQGAITPALSAAPDATNWVGSSYPQHFHATIAAIIELLRGTRVVTSPESTLLDYGRMVALLQVLVAGLLAAGVLQLPAIRKRPAMAWPLISLVIAAFVFGPGTKALYTGYPNFVLACGTAGLTVLLSVSAIGRRVSSLWVLALGGLVVATTHGWALLVPMPLVAFCVVVPPSTWRGSHKLTLRLLIAMIAVASMSVLPILFYGQSIVLAVGGLPTVGMASLLMISGAALGLTLMISIPDKNSELMQTRLLLLGVVGVGLGLLIGLATYQLIQAGVLSYYFGKLATGVMLISSTVLIAAIAMLIGQAKAMRNPSRLLLWSCSIFLTIAAIQTFGYVGPYYRYVAEEAPFITWNNGIELLEDDTSAARIIAAAGVSQKYPFASTVYVAAAPGEPVPQLADQWVRALSLNWSKGSDASGQTLGRVGISFGKGEHSAQAVTKELLDADDNRVVIVAPEALKVIRDNLPTEYQARVVTW
jgi:hypothetical protein